MQTRLTSRATDADFVRLAVSDTQGRWITVLTADDTTAVKYPYYQVQFI
jgi:hypothetical protein